MPTFHEIAATLVLIYLLFVKIGYMDDDSINWAPHTKRPLNVNLCHSVGLDNSAIDFIQRYHGVWDDHFRGCYGRRLGWTGGPIGAYARVVILQMQTFLLQ
jgi:hypothetical protein